MTEEFWKDIKGYEGIYEVSNHGRVRTHKDKTTHNAFEDALPKHSFTIRNKMRG